MGGARQEETAMPKVERAYLGASVCRRVPGAAASGAVEPEGWGLLPEEQKGHILVRTLIIIPQRLIPNSVQPNWIGE